jgi:hypothetical protein
MSIWPALIYIGLNLMALGLSMAKHGEPKKGNENFFLTLFSVSLVFGLLWWGGFFDALFHRGT